MKLHLRILFLFPAFQLLICASANIRDLQFEEFETPPECISVCPNEEPGSDSCIQETIGDCTCVYSDPYCMYECLNGTWGQMCQFGGVPMTPPPEVSPVAPPTEAPDPQFEEFETPPECISVCPNEEPVSGSCIQETIGDCTCVYSDRYCMYECLNGNWGQMCQKGGVPVTPPPEVSPVAPPIEAPDRCTDKCPAKEPEINVDTCDEDDIGMCNCYVPNDPYCMYQCQDGVWRMMCYNVDPELPQKPTKSSKKLKKPKQPKNKSKLKKTK